MQSYVAKIATYDCIIPFVGVSPNPPKQSGKEFEKMNDEKIKSFEDQIKKIQAKRSKLIRLKKEKEQKQKTENALKILEILENMGIDTIDKTMALKTLLQGNEEFEKMVLNFNIEVIE